MPSIIMKITVTPRTDSLKGSQGPPKSPRPQ